MRRLLRLQAALVAAVLALGLASAASATADSPPPAIYVGVATSYNTVRLQMTEPVDPASVQPSDFFLTMAGANRAVTSAYVSPDGFFIFINSPNTWLPGQAGLVHLTAPGAVSSTAGVPSVSTDDAHVGGAPGDFTPPRVSRFAIEPRRKLCFRASRRCRRPGAHVAFSSTKDGTAYLTVKRGNRVLGSEDFLTRPGANFLRWDGKILGHYLRPGSYRAWLAVKDNVGNVTPLAQQPTFKLKVTG